MQLHPIGLRRTRGNVRVRWLRAQDQRSRHEPDKNRKQYTFHTPLFTSLVAACLSNCATDLCTRSSPSSFVILHSSFASVFCLLPSAIAQRFVDPRDDRTAFPDG